MNREELIGKLEALTSKLIDGAELDVILDLLDDLVIQARAIEE